MATVVGRLIRIVEHVPLQEGQQAIVSSRTGLDINSDEFVFGTVTVNGSAFGLLSGWQRNGSDA